MTYEQIQAVRRERERWVETIRLAAVALEEAGHYVKVSEDGLTLQVDNRLVGVI